MHELLEDMGEIIRLALVEDAFDRDITTLSLISEHAFGEGSFLVKAPGVIAGLPIAETVFREVDSKITFETLLPDGSSVRKGEIVAIVKGPLASILRAERVALNFLQQLSGVATKTARYVAAVDGTTAEILDTRKTTPGLRRLQKYAVQMGGGRNHRMDLSDGMLVKDNHIAALRARELSLFEITQKALKATPDGMMVEIEVTSVAEAEEAMSAGAKLILLDNMSPDEMRKAVAIAKRHLCKLEASGGITLETIRDVAQAGVDFISIGALTHSSKALDISLEIAGV